jgi:hypothetical protein
MPAIRLIDVWSGAAHTAHKHASSAMFERARRIFRGNADHAFETSGHRRGRGAISRCRYLIDDFGKLLPSNGGRPSTRTE